MGTNMQHKRFLTAQECYLFFQTIIQGTKIFLKLVIDTKKKLYEP